MKPSVLRVCYCSVNTGDTGGSLSWSGRFTLQCRSHLNSLISIQGDYRMLRLSCILWGAHLQQPIPWLQRPTSWSTSPFKATWLLFHPPGTTKMSQSLDVLLYSIFSPHAVLSMAILAEPLSWNAGLIEFRVDPSFLIITSLGAILANSAAKSFCVSAVEATPFWTRLFLELLPHRGIGGVRCCLDPGRGQCRITG